MESLTETKSISKYVKFRSFYPPSHPIVYSTEIHNRKKNYPTYQTINEKKLIKSRAMRVREREDTGDLTFGAN